LHLGVGGAELALDRPQRGDDRSPSSNANPTAKLAANKIQRWAAVNSPGPSFDVAA
jgi:hypothetical protein